MNPARALEEMSLLKMRLSTPQYAAYVEAYEEDVERKKAGFSSGSTGQPDGWTFTRREQRRLEMAEAYFLSAEMQPLVRWASAGLNNTDRFERDLWPTDFGFLLFEDGLAVTEMWGRKVVTKAISWGRQPGRTKDGRTLYGTWVVFYTDINDTRDEVNVQIKAAAQAEGDWEKYEAMGHLHVHNMLWIADDQRVGPAKVVPPERFAQYAVGDQKLASEVDSDGRFILALLMMLNQTVTDVSDHEMDKRTAKRFRRMGLPGKVTVIKLRRHKDANRQDGESLVEWSHRWVVRGHWRNQPYRGEGGTTVYKRIWIAPFIKGPDGAPLKQSEKVYALVR